LRYFEDIRLVTLYQRFTVGSVELPMLGPELRSAVYRPLEEQWCLLIQPPA
jgi:hypothetical protein